MRECEWNISAIILESIRDWGNVSYAKMAKTLGCSEQTLLNWKKGMSMPRKSYIDDMCSKFPSLLKNREEEYLAFLKGKFSDAGSKVKDALEYCDSVSSMIKYLYENLEKDADTDKLYNLFNDPDNFEFLKEIVMRKFQINKEKTQIFQMEILGDSEKKAMQNEEMGWKLNLDHCFFLRFKESERKYTYKVLVNFNFNQRDYEEIGDYAEARNATKAYGAKMILLFGNATIPDKEMNFWMDSNIYTENITSHEIIEKEESKDYVYSKSNTDNIDFEMEILANKYADIVIGKLRKYFSVIFKNILFDARRPLTAKQKDSYIFWEAKYATRHHINFQENRIRSLLEENMISGNETALAIGYLSFPCMLRMANTYKKIYLLDNSNTAVRVYEQYLTENAPELLEKVKFITFTSALFSAITEKYHLYCSVDFILIGTGSGSFIKKLQTYYQMCNIWLKNKGLLYISFLNNEFLYEYVDRVTVEQNFEFVPDIAEKKATVLICNNTERYDLYCETYECNEIRSMAEKYFQFEKMYSYPLASVLEGTHKSKLQNILKELDKEYSKNGFVNKNFSNCRGYYIDSVLKKNIGRRIYQEIPIGYEMKRIVFDDRKKYEQCYLKTLLLTEKTSSRIDGSNEKVIMEIYVIVLPTKKMLPETTNKEICIGARKFRLLEISEINALGIEYKNISPFLKTISDIKLNCSYDAELLQKKNKLFYIGDGSNDGGHEIKGSELLKLLNLYNYSDINIQ